MICAGHEQCFAGGMAKAGGNDQRSMVDGNGRCKKVLGKIVGIMDDGSVRQGSAWI